MFHTRKLLGVLARIAARTATDFVRATLDEPELSVGLALCIQTHESLLNWQPYIHALITYGGFRRDGTLVRLPAHSAATDSGTGDCLLCAVEVADEAFEPGQSGAGRRGEVWWRGRRGAVVRADGAARVIGAWRWAVAWVRVGV